MSSVKNDWIGYLDRSYQQIKTSLLARITTSNPEMTDHSESNPLIIFIGMFSGVAEMLGFYVDNAARESHIAVARRRSSIILESKILDYRIKARYPEQVDLLITWNAAIPAAFTLQSGFTIQSDTGVLYRLLNDTTILLGALVSSIPISQEAPITLNFTTDGSKNQRVNLGTSYVQNRMDLTIAPYSYTEVETFANSGPSDKHYIIDIESDDNAYLILGDGINGYLPTNASPGVANYNTTLGPTGKVGAGKFVASTIVVNGVLPGGVTITSANSLINSSGGAFYEDTEKIRTNSIRSIRTLQRMVTKTDHEFVIDNVAGVAKSKVNFDCGKTIDIYIVPEGGGVAQTLLISAAQTRAEETKMVATFPVVRPAGETRLVVGADVTAKKRKSLVATRVQVENALVEFGLVANQEINGAIRLSDLQALIDNQTNVEFVDIIKMYTIPYARPIDHTNILNWTNETTVLSTVPIAWGLEFDGVLFRVFRESVFLGTIAINSQFTQPEFFFTIAAGSYVAGNTYTFTTMPYLKNLQLIDFTIFTIQVGDLNINVLPNPVV